MPNEAGQSPEASGNAATKPHYLHPSLVESVPIPPTNLLVGTSDLLLDEHQLGLHNADNNGQTGNSASSVSSTWPFNVSIS